MAVTQRWVSALTSSTGWSTNGVNYAFGSPDGLLLTYPTTQAAFGGNGGFAERSDGVGGVCMSYQFTGKLSSGFLGNGDNKNLLTFLNISGGGDPLKPGSINYNGGGADGTGDITLVLWRENTTPDTPLTANVASGVLPRDAEHQIYATIYWGTAGNADGKFKMWVNHGSGWVLTHDYSDVNLLPATCLTTINFQSISTVWGGGGSFSGNVPVEFYRWLKDATFETGSDAADFDTMAPAAPAAPAVAHLKMLGAQ